MANNIGDYLYVINHTKMCKSLIIRLSLVNPVAFIIRDSAFIHTLRRLKRDALNLRGKKHAVIDKFPLGNDSSGYYIT